MDLEPQPPPSPNPNPTSHGKKPPANKPPDKTPTPFEGITVLLIANPYDIPILEEKAEAHWKSLEEALKKYRAPFEFCIDQALSFDGLIIGVNVSSKVFNDAVTLVLATLECGYYQVENPIPLGTTDWARLACTTLIATGHGYTKQYKHGPEEPMEKVHAESTDPSPLSQSHPMLFHCLTAMAEHLESHTSSNIELYQTWFSSIKAGFYEKASEAAAIEVFQTM
ncbi:hypothetical protein BJV74DRAFT_796941 [Russula compacta]|nr:hypothetical protein BJV74DRAFT_796941 [Russula compacta]